MTKLNLKNPVMTLSPLRHQNLSQIFSNLLPSSQSKFLATPVLGNGRYRFNCTVDETSSVLKRSAIYTLKSWLLLLFEIAFAFHFLHNTVKSSAKIMDKKAVMQS